MPRADIPETFSIDISLNLVQHFYLTSHHVTCADARSAKQECFWSILGALMSWCLKDVA